CEHNSICCRRRCENSCTSWPRDNSEVARLRPMPSRARAKSTSTREKPAQAQISDCGAEPVVSLDSSFIGASISSWPVACTSTPEQVFLEIQPRVAEQRVRLHLRWGCG